MNFLRFGKLHKAHWQDARRTDGLWRFLIGSVGASQMTFAGRREMCKADMGSVFKNRNTACRTFAQIMSLVTKMNYLEFLTGLP